MTPQLELSTVFQDDTCRISVRGELDMDSSPKLLEEIRKGLQQGCAVEVCLRDVPYMDSSGIAVLVQGYKLAQKRSRDFALTDPSRQVRSVMELSHLQSFFTIRDSGSE